jgi:hypothetical protein
VEPWTMSSNVNFHRTVENLASEKKNPNWHGSCSASGKGLATIWKTGVLAACDISCVFLAWLGTSIWASAHFFPQPSRWESQRERVKPESWPSQITACNLWGPWSCPTGWRLKNMLPRHQRCHRLTSQGPLPWSNIHELC